jgi:hypothetical protein
MMKERQEVPLRAFVVWDQRDRGESRPGDEGYFSCQKIVRHAWQSQKRTV